jgi:hypothetical protein
MLLVKIINAICPLDPNTKHNVQSMFKAIQNTYCLIIVSYVTYALFTRDIPLYLRVGKIIQWQCIFDMLLCSPELVIHHLFAIGIMHPFLTTPGLEMHTHNEMSTILSTELSTIFLVLRNIIPTKYKRLGAINNAIFIATFVYTRLYTYSTQLIYSEHVHYMLTTYLPPSKSMLLFTSLYGLYFLNIYWAAIILKTLVKQYKPVMPTFQQCESFIKYMYFTSPLASLVLYRPFTNHIYLFDTVGQGMLAVSSYEYHNAASRHLPDKNVLDQDLLWLYINDVLLIHVRCFFCILTNANLYTYLTKNLPIMNLKMGIVSVSFLAHTSSMYNVVKYLFTLRLCRYKSPTSSAFISDKDNCCHAPETCEGVRLCRYKSPTSSAFISDKDNCCYAPETCEGVRLCRYKSPTSSAFISDKDNCCHAPETCEGVKTDNHILTINGDDDDKMLPIQFFQGFPILLDSLIVAFSTNSLTHRNNILVITALIFINGKVAPFYHMNHLVFHALLLLQTIFLCQSNMEANDQMLNHPI